MDEDIKKFMEWLQSEVGDEWRRMVPKYVSKEIQITLLVVAWMFGRYRNDILYLFELVPRLLLKWPKLR